MFLGFFLTAGVVSGIPTQGNTARHSADTTSHNTFVLPSIPGLYPITAENATSSEIRRLAGFAWMCYQREEYRLAAENYHAAYLLATRENQPAYAARLAHNLCLCHLHTNDIVAYFTYCQQALQQWSSLSDEAGRVATLLSMAPQYLAMGNQDSALVVARESLSLCRTNQLTELEPTSLTMLGRVLLAGNEADSAQIYLTSALSLLDSEGQPRGVADAQFYRGSTFAQQGLWIEAIAAFTAAAAHYRAAGLYGNQCMAYAHAAAASFQHQDIQSAKAYLDSADALIDYLPARQYNTWMLFYKVKYQCAEISGDLASSHRFFRMYARYHDSVQYESKRTNPDQLRANYILHQKSIALQAAMDNSHRKQLRARVLLFTAILLLAGVGTFNYRIGKKLRSARQEHDKLNRELELLYNRHFSETSGTLQAEGTQLLCKEKIEEHIGFPLNDTDWTLLQVLAVDPNANNKELSEKIGITHEGVRSALKKLYRLFHIDDVVSNKKMALAVAATMVCRKS